MENKIIQHNNKKKKKAMKLHLPALIITLAVMILLFLIILQSYLRKAVDDLYLYPSTDGNANRIDQDKLLMTDDIDSDFIDRDESFRIKGNAMEIDKSISKSYTLKYKNKRKNHKNKKLVLVTGGAGFIGSHAALKLLELGHDVIVLDNLSRGNIEVLDVLNEMSKSNPLYGSIDFVQIDLGNIDILNDFLFNYSISNDIFDVIMHFAAVAYVAESTKYPNLYYQNITSNTGNLLSGLVNTQNLLLTRNGKYKKQIFIYSSTCAVFGDKAIVPVTELTPVNPTSPYGRAKFFAEHMVYDTIKSNEFLYGGVLRYFNVIGANPKGIVGEVPKNVNKLHERVSSACFNAMLGNREYLYILGEDFPTRDGTAIRDYIHVSDLVDAHIALMENLGSSQMQIKQIIEPKKDMTSITNIPAGKSQGGRERERE